MGPLRRHAMLGVILAVYLAVAVSYGLLNPLGESPDETAHVNLIRFISQEGHLPTSLDERQVAGYKADKPMLYHALLGWLTRWVDCRDLMSLKVSNASSRRLLIEDGLSPFSVIHTEDEAPPYQGVVLLWHVARLVSSLLGAATLIVIYLTLRRLCPDQPWLALTATASLAAWPQFHALAASVNDDNLLGLLSALFTLNLVAAWQQPERRRTYLWLGFWLGLALTTKYSVGLFPLLVFAMLLVGVRRARLSGRMALQHGLLFLGALVLAAAWWFLYVGWYFNQVEQLGLWGGLLKPLLAGGLDVSMQRAAVALGAGIAAVPAPSVIGVDSWWNWLRAMFVSFWLPASPVDHGLRAAACVACLALALIAMLGLGTAWRRRLPLPWGGLGWLALQMALLIPFPALRFYLSHNAAEAGQGRHILFPAATAIGVLFSAGVLAWLPAARRRWAGWGLAAGLLTISLVHFWGVLLPAFPERLPVRNTRQAARSVPNPMQVSFGPAMQLIGWQIDAVNASGALPVTLYWHSLAEVDQDYLTELTLLDASGAMRSQWLGHPVNGRYPTRAWERGDVIRDAYWVPLPGLPAGNYRLRLRLRPAEPTGQAANAALPGSWETAVTLSAPAAWPPATYVLWQDGQPASQPPLYRQRATIALSWLGDSPSALALSGPDGVLQTPLVQGNGSYLFIVGPRWPSGDYRLYLEPGGPDSGRPLLRVQQRARTFQPSAVSQPVQANFADEVTLLGYDLPGRRAEPGGALSISVYWQARRALQRHYVVFNHLLNQADLRQYGGRDRVPGDYYSTMLWAAGEVVRDDYLVPVNPDAPPGVYRLDIGLYLEVAGQARSLPLIADGIPLDVSSVTIAPIKVGGPPPGVTVTHPVPQQVRADRLGDQVTLIGFDLEPETDSMRLTLYWRCDSSLMADYTTFAHVLDATGKLVAQMDRPPAAGAYPSSLWEPGEVIRDELRLPMGGDILAGEYTIVVGLYQLSSGARLPVQGSPDDSITLTRVTWP